MPFVNRVRLPIKVTRPQLVAERDIFRKANGEIKVLSVVIRKQYEGETDLLPEKYHERLIIALSHDDVRIEGERYIGNVVQDGDYTINWVDFLDYPIAKATFKVFATPFDASNTNCGTCEEVIQVVANDDDAGTVGQGDTIIVDVLANDDICCEPVTITLMTTNSDYVQSVSVVDNELHITIKTPVSQQNNVLLVTYRAQCENGQYDDANVYANITGSGPAVCLSPIELEITAISSTEVTIDWATFPGGAVYEYLLYLATDLINPVQSGSVAVTTVTLTGLTPSTEYVFKVRMDCGGGSFSNYASISFTTNPPSDTESCGEYFLVMNLPEGDINDFCIVQYIDCNGESQVIVVPNFSGRTICALQNSPGDPVFITTCDGVTVIYQGLCTE